MKRINTYAFFTLGDLLGDLKSINGSAEGLDVLSKLLLAGTALDAFLSEIEGLGVSSDAAHKVKAALNAVAETFKTDSNQTLATRVALGLLQSRRREFESILAAELQRLDTYMLTQIGGYSMPILVRNAEANLPQDVAQTIPDEARTDFREAGKCLAFELATASGYHVMRATEKVLRHYHERVTGKVADRMDWKPCLDELRASGADAKTLQVLDQIREFHRNPVAHPEISLTMKEAQGLFNIAISAITAMMDQIAKLPVKKAAATAASGAP